MVITTKEEARKVLIEELQWEEYQIEVGLRADFKCEYCGKSLLESYEHYDQWQVDHIIPNGDNNLENLALSCKLCNFVKRQTDPSSQTDKLDRESLISVAREIISQRRQRKSTAFLRTLEAIDVLRQA